MFSDNEVNGCDDDDDDWAVDVSDAAVAERMKDLTAGVKRLTVSNNADKSQSERLELFFNYCKVNYYTIIFNYYLSTTRTLFQLLQGELLYYYIQLLPFNHSNSFSTIAR